MFTDYILIRNIWSLYHWCSDHKSNDDHQPHIWTCMTIYLVTLLPLSQFHLLNPLAKHSIDGHSRPGMRSALLPTAAAPEFLGGEAAVRIIVDHHHSSYSKLYHVQVPLCMFSYPKGIYKRDQMVKIMSKR